MAFGVSLFVVIDFVKLGCVVSEVCCSILEIDLVKQAFLVRAIFFKCVSGLLFVEIDSGRIAVVKNISCIASLCCLSFIKHIYSETWCSVLCHCL